MIHFHVLFMCCSKCGRTLYLVLCAQIMLCAVYVVLCTVYGLLCTHITPGALCPGLVVVCILCVDYTA